MLAKESLGGELERTRQGDRNIGGERVLARVEVHFFSEECIYNERGDLLEMVRRDKRGRVIFSEEREYDEQDRLTIALKVNNGVSSFETYQYDGQGRLVLVVEKDIRGKLISSKEYKYDKKV